LNLVELGESDTFAARDENVRQEESPLGKETCVRGHAEDATANG
jgi:hypothetical protein